MIRRMTIYALPEEPVFPDPREAEPDGLIAVGGDLSARRVLTAYACGIFPWPIEGLPLTWFSPDPRMVLRRGGLRVTRSLRKTLRSGRFAVTMDGAFAEVMEACAELPRAGQRGTWITPEIRRAYGELHALGYAHSVEVWRGGVLVGGLYGVSIGGMFCGESMFHRERDASKVAFAVLATQLEAWGFTLLDCQVPTPHLASLGAEEVSREVYLEAVEAALEVPGRRGRWALELDVVAAI
jgi:leucyl/phenylalanyl-tRNA--protein transferase